MRARLVPTANACLQPPGAHRRGPTSSRSTSGASTRVTNPARTCASVEGLKDAETIDEHEDPPAVGVGGEPLGLYWPGGNVTLVLVWYALARRSSGFLPAQAAQLAPR
jgi:hypothetical protein